LGAVDLPNGWKFFLQTVDTNIRNWVWSIVTMDHTHYQSSILTIINIIMITILLPSSLVFIIIIILL
jgi:hypothetical protein